MAGTSDPSSTNLEMSNSSANNETLENSMFKRMFDEYRAKDEQISRLTVEIEELRKENSKLKAQQSVKMPEQSINIRNYDPKQKAQELKNALTKVVDDILLSQSHEHPNRSHYVNRQQLVSGSTAIVSHVDVNHSLMDTEEKNTNNVPINHPPPLLNNSFISHESPIPEYQVRPSNDQEVISQATPPLISHFTSTLPDGRLNYSTLPPSPRRSNNSLNNNNNNHYYNNINNPNNNNNNNKNNKKNKPDKPLGYSQAKHTIFIAWTGSMTPEGLKSLFRNEDVEDIRYLPNKQFAHVDLKTEAALKRALELNDQIKSPEQGKLRVELGKPRATSSTENNGQRSQQNKPNYRQPNNNNNNNNNKQNGYNPQQKHQKQYTSPNGYLPNNYNGHSQEEIRGIAKTWHNFQTSESQGRGGLMNLNNNHTSPEYNKYEWQESRIVPA